MAKERHLPLTPIVATLLVVGQLVAAYAMNPYLHWWPENMTYRMPHATMGVLLMSLLAHRFPKIRRPLCFLAGVGVTWLLGHAYVPHAISAARLGIWSLIAGVAMSDLLPTGE
ncbi:MAG: hypothetical protein KDA28_14855, partial [Phycisphaerales bacterium]|nr:hypothetical protein [Phycisphaerales bacterium]